MTFATRHTAMIKHVLGILFLSAKAHVPYIATKREITNLVPHYFLFGNRPLCKHPSNLMCWHLFAIKSKTPITITSLTGSPRMTSVWPAGAINPGPEVDYSLFSCETFIHYVVAVSFRTVF